MYRRNQAITYPPGPHISRATDIKIVVDKVCPRIPLRDEGKKREFKIYHYAEMPSRSTKVEVETTQGIGVLYLVAKGM